MDDITVAAPAIKHGLDYDEVHEKLVYTPGGQWEPPDVRTMKVLQKIANSLDKNLSFTVDCLGLQETRRLPILDIVVWLDWGAEGWRLRHSFFKKECSSDLTIMARIALSARCKRQTLFQECMRRLWAMDVHTTAEER